MKWLTWCVVVFCLQGCNALECRVHYSADECETLFLGEQFWRDVT